MHEKTIHEAADRIQAYGEWKRKIRRGKPKFSTITAVRDRRRRKGSGLRTGMKQRSIHRRSALVGREIYPRCMLNTLREICEGYGDIDVYITENSHGCYETLDENGIMQDDERIEMMQGYIDSMFRAMEESCPVRGYYAWSTMDLCSWVNGYEKRYGLVCVDFEDNCRRIRKKSYGWYKQLIEDFKNNYFLIAARVDGSSMQSC